MKNTLYTLLPTPVSVTDRGNHINIGSLAWANISFAYPKGGDILNSAVAYIVNSLSSYCISPSDSGYSIVLEINPSDIRFGTAAKSEGYIIDVSAGKCEVIAYDEPGAYYGAITLSKIIYAEENDIFIPECTIIDYPKFPKRGHFMECRYGSDFMTYSDWQKAIDYLSEMKINTIVMGLYGCWNRQYDGWFAEYQYVPFKNHPELNTPRNIKYYSAKEGRWIYKKDILPVMYETDYLGDLMAYAKRKNIIIIPLFNSLGHNTLIPRLHPEISAIDEDGNYAGVGLCTNNEKTYEFMFSLYDEIIDRYLTPNGIDSFHIGLDEVMDVVGSVESDLHLSKSPMCKCDKCKDRIYGELMLEYIVRITKYMVPKGINNVYVYHDMLLNYDLLNEKTAEYFKSEGVYDNIIIDWWSYNKRETLFEGKADKVNGLFRSIGKPITGYYNWCCLMESSENIGLIKDIARLNDFEGIVAYSTFDYGYDFNYLLLSESGWNPDSFDSDEALKKYVSLKFSDNYTAALDAVKLANEFMTGDGSNLTMYFFGYYVSSYLYKNVEYPRNYPANQFKKISEDPEYLNYLHTTYAKSKFVYDYFKDNINTPEGKRWQFGASVYMLTCDVFLTIYSCADAYNKGIITKKTFISELNRLNVMSDVVLSLCEEVRFDANRYTIMRNISVSKQFVCDLTNTLSLSDIIIKLDDFSEILSPLSMFLR